MIDHRKLGRELELFHTDPLIGAGLPIWLPAGAAARHEIERFIREEERLAGYQHVYSPPVAKQEMYARSGHLEKFADDMFGPMGGDDEPEPLVLRPSLCPHHAMVFRARGRSYRELPLRIAELGGMYRSERSGVLGGLTRVRAIWLNDAHIFCAEDQVAAEVAGILAMVGQAHRALGFAADGFRLSKRGDLVEGKYLGEADRWDRAEGLLRSALVDSGVAFEEAAGEGAFYGPKIDIQVRDVAGREFTLATIQVDFVQPERFDLSYTDRGGAKARPVMVHRSIVGGLERLFAHLIEVHQGAFPVWYAPVQLVAVPIGDDQREAAQRLVGDAMRRGLRAEVSADGSLGARVSEARHRRVPYVAVIGPREAEAGEVSLRLRDGRQLPAMPAAAAIGLISSIVEERSSELAPR
ncbi:threonyl-tRNA synthetase [Allocatelliglobosispora scoriae]|uniref:Threonine--tRNA ligase n=1 Tax=Allocatelliglobosispora scoriae TaxID=643052 RepID=A0A841BLX2_9ACTN|nr:threonine--tRNA ligase [Allocatelliglobosispora scoriae]MBB5867973.1 threonyl-tRNA synthetase [Allocatelliglobosispora scoriae]